MTEKKERNKGSSVLKKLADYTVVDIETTGKAIGYDEIIELGALRVRGGVAVDSFQELVKPSSEIRGFISELTGITNAMLSSAAGISEALPKFMDFIGGDILIGHNINVFDSNFIYDAWKGLSGKDFKNDYIDTLLLARKVLKNLKHHRLSDLKEYYRVDIPEAHRSLADCNSAFAVYKALLSDIDAQNIDFLSLSKSVGSGRKLKASDISANTAIDKDSQLFGKVVAITGTLERMPRREAERIVANLGGINADSVTKKTNLLVLGNLEYASGVKDGKSGKLKKAEELILKGSDLDIINEDSFFEMAGLE